MQSFDYLAQSNSSNHIRLDGAKTIIETFSSAALVYFHEYSVAMGERRTPSAQATLNDFPMVLSFDLKIPGRPRTYWDDLCSCDGRLIPASTTSYGFQHTTGSNYCTPKTETIQLNTLLCDMSFHSRIHPVMCECVTVSVSQTVRFLETATHGNMQSKTKH